MERPHRSRPGTARAGFLGWALLLFLLATTGCGERVPRRPNVLLISIDTLRPDHLGCYGYGRPTSPSLDRLAAEGALFRCAVSTTSWTLPAHVSLLTSLYNGTHRVNASFHRIDPARVLLAETLRAAGYRTAGFVSGPFLHAAFGFDQGFDEYVYCAHYPGVPPQTAAAPISARVQDASHHDVSSPKVNARVLPWLEAHRDEPFFLFVHYFDPHYDYIPPAPYDTLFDVAYNGSLDPRGYLDNDAISPGMRPEDLDHVIALYDGEIRFTDDHVGALLAEIDSLGLRGKTIVIVTSDHGEEFFEHGAKGHFQTLFDESVRIPLILRFPGRITAGEEITGQVRIIDIVPTILDLCGLEGSGEETGTSLVPLAGDPRAPHPARNLADLYVEGHALLSLRTNAWKVVYDFESKENVLYDLRADPSELHPIPLDPSLPEFERVREMFRIREGITALGNALPWTGGGGEPLPPEVAASLRALGYLK